MTLNYNDKNATQSKNAISESLLDLLNKFDPTNDFPTPTTLTSVTVRLATTLLNIPTSDLLTMPTQRSHSPLSRLDVLKIPFRQPSRNKCMFEPAVMPLAHWLRPAAVKIRRHQPSAKDAFSPSARGIAALCDESSDRSLFAIGGCFHVAKGWRGQLEEEVPGREFQGDEAGGLDVSGDLLDEFGGKSRKVRCFGQVDCLILQVRHVEERLVCAFLVDGGDDEDDGVLLLQRRRCPGLVTPRAICLPAARLLACSVGQGWTPRVTVSVPGTGGE
jgi:hypothetical protein